MPRCVLVTGYLLYWYFYWLNLCFNQSNIRYYYFLVVSVDFICFIFFCFQTPYYFKRTDGSTYSQGWPVDFHTNKQLHTHKQQKHVRTLMHNLISFVKHKNHLHAYTYRKTSKSSPLYKECSHDSDSRTRHDEQANQRERPHEAATEHGHSRTRQQRLSGTLIPSFPRNTNWASLISKYV